MTRQLPNTWINGRREEKIIISVLLIYARTGFVSQACGGGTVCVMAAECLSYLVRSPWSHCKFHRCSTRLTWHQTPTLLSLIPANQENNKLFVDSSSKLLREKVLQSRYQLQGSHHGPSELTRLPRCHGHICQFSYAEASSGDVDNKSWVLFCFVKGKLCCWVESGCLYHTLLHTTSARRPISSVIAPFNSQGWGWEWQAAKSSVEGRC